MTEEPHFLHPWTPSSAGHTAAWGQLCVQFGSMALYAKKLDEFFGDYLVWPGGDAAEGLWSGPIDDWYNSHRFEWTEAIPRCGKKFGTIVQAGGAFGMYPYLLSKIFDSVYTFEPNNFSFSIMAINTSQRPNIHRFEAALGGSEDPHVNTWTRAGGNYGETKTSCIADGINSIPTMAIDSLNLYSLDMIALDVEGDEMNALSGAEVSIEAFRPVIVAELGGDLILDYLRTIADYKIIGKSRSDTIFGVLTE